MAVAGALGRAGSCAASRSHGSVSGGRYGRSAASPAVSWHTGLGTCLSLEVRVRIVMPLDFIDMASPFL